MNDEEPAEAEPLRRGSVASKVARLERTSTGPLLPERRSSEARLFDGPGAARLAQLEVAKVAAVEREDFVEAVALKERIGKVRALIDDFARFEAEKRSAAAREDYLGASEAKARAQEVAARLSVEDSGEAGASEAEGVQQDSVTSREVLPGEGQEKKPRLDMPTRKLSSHSQDDFLTPRSEDGAVQPCAVPRNPAFQIRDPAACKLLCIVLDNLLERGSEPRFRRVSDDAVRKRCSVGGYNEAVRSLMSFGFELDHSDPAVPAWVLPEVPTESFALDRLRKAKSVLSAPPVSFDAVEDGAVASQALKGLAERHAECPISFEHLCQGRVGVFLGEDGRRVSPHFFRYEAAMDWLAVGTGRGQVAECPMTRRRVTEVRLVPSLLEDAVGWFAACDVDGDGQLSRREVVEALKAQLPLDGDALEEFVASDEAWRSWDSDASGFVELREVVGSSGEGGLATFVRETFARAAAEAPVPDIRADRRAWFRRWDEDGSGDLSQEEVVRSFVKTFGWGSSPDQVRSLRELLSALWCEFDPDGSGDIDVEEFCRPGEGLADVVIANLGL